MKKLFIYTDILALIVLFLGPIFPSMFCGSLMPFAEVFLVFFLLPYLLVFPAIPIASLLAKKYNFTSLLWIFWFLDLVIIVAVTWFYYRGYSIGGLCHGIRM